MLKQGSSALDLARVVSILALEFPMPHLLTIILVLLVVTTPSAAEPVLATDFSTASSLSDTRWAASTWKRPDGSLSLEQASDGSGQVLAINVQAKAEAVSLPRLKVAANTVYGISFEGRSVGQIEGLGLTLRRASDPFTHHGSDGFPVSREWQRYATQITVEHSDADTVLILRFRGIGRYELRSVSITPQEQLIVPESDGFARGELLFDPGFALGGIGWHYTTPDWGDHKANYFASDNPPAWTQHADGSSSFVSEAGIFGFLTHAEDLTLRYGKTYRVRVRGSGSDGDAFVWIARPGSNVKIIKKVPLTFTDGVAVGSYEHQVPRYGTFSGRAEKVYLRVEHFGKHDLRIDGVSLVEVGSESVEVADSARPQAGLRVVAGADALGGTVRGSTLRLSLRTVDIPLGTTVQIRAFDAEGLVVQEHAAQVVALPEGGEGASVTIENLPLGWFRLAPVLAGQDGLITRDAVVVCVPHVRSDAAPGFLGSHITAGDPRQLPHAKSIGIQSARCFEFSWASIEAKQGAFNFPDDQLNAYLEAGVEPMVILNGTPRWASSAPANIREKTSPWAGWNKYPPTDIATWRSFVRTTVEHLKGRVQVYQIWNEPNDYFLKVNKDTGVSLEQAYVDLAREAYAVIKEVDPDATVVVGATAGSAPHFFRRCFEKGLLKHADVVSYHAYGECQYGLRGAPAFAKEVGALQAMMAKHGRVLPIWDCESGFNANGLDDAMVLLAGLISRQAAGIERHYIYSSGPRDFPGQSNFHMLRGVADQPLIGEALVAVHDRLLGGADFTENIGDDAAGKHCYAFTRTDGTRVLVGWSSGAEASAKLALDGAENLVAVTAFGHPCAGIADEGLLLDHEPRYFIVGADLERLK